MLNGIDADQDGNIDAKPGEGGAQAAYDAAYHMADMPLEAVGVLNLGTGTPTFISLPPTGSGAGAGTGSVSGGTPLPTERVPPGQQGRTPKPTHENNNNGGGGNGGGNGGHP